MKGEWCYFKSYLNPTTCDQLVNNVLTRPAVSGTVGRGQQVVESVRRSKVRFIGPQDPELGFFFDVLWRVALQANRDWFNFHLTKLDFFQIAEYRAEEQGEYRRHHDVFWVNDTDYHRKLSCIIQLSDPSDYEGGDLTFYDVNQYPDAADLRAKGTVVFFPSFVSHAAVPLTRGTRYSLAAWFEGPKFR
jgi:PKHD-type hydroxylase